MDEEKSKKRKEAVIALTLRTSSCLVKLPLRLLNSATLPLLVSAIMLALATPAPSQAGTLYRLEHVRSCWPTIGNSQTGMGSGASVIIKSGVGAYIGAWNGTKIGASKTGRRREGRTSGFSQKYGVFFRKLIVGRALKVNQYYRFRSV